MRLVLKELSFKLDKLTSLKSASIALLIFFGMGSPVLRLPSIGMLRCSSFRLMSNDESIGILPNKLPKSSKNVLHRFVLELEA